MCDFRSTSTIIVRVTWPTGWGFYIFAPPRLNSRSRCVVSVDEFFGPFPEQFITLHSSLM
jgi:hypothetical protein